MLNATEIVSASTVKVLVVEQGRFLKSNEFGVASYDETASYRFFLLKLRVAKYELNWNLVKTLPSQTLKLKVAKVFLSCTFILNVIQTFVGHWKLNRNNQVILVSRSFLLKYSFN